MGTARKLDEDQPTTSRPSSKSDGIADAIDRYYKQIADLSIAYVPVSLDLIELQKLPDITLYLSHARTGLFRVFRGKGLYISQTEVDSLASNDVAELFIDRTDIPAFTTYVESLLQEMQSSSAMATEQAVNLLRTSAIHVMQDIFVQPSPENIARGVKAVSGFVYTLMRDPKAYRLLLSLSSHDHYTLQHSVGVATNAIILAKKAGINDEKSLIEVGVGGLLHDIGKTKIPKEVINKKGPLDESEWQEMKKHSLYGYEILKDNRDIGTRARLAVMQHHEDHNGTGYPMGLRADQVSITARIVTLADIFNAITTDRSYSQAKPPFEAFKLIKEKLFYKVDPKLFELLVLIYGGKID